MTANNPQKKWVGASLASAFGASLCCVTPVFAVLAGFGGVATLFSWVEPVRPYIVGLTVLLLGYAWYQKLMSEGVRSTLFLGIATGLIGLLLTFPYYSDTLFSKMNDQNASLSKDKTETVTVAIKGMTCSGCEIAVEQAVKQVDGVVEATASSKAGTAMVKFVPMETNEHVIADAIRVTGLTVASIHFSENAVQNRNIDKTTSGSFCSLQGDGSCAASCTAPAGCTKNHLETYLDNHANGNPAEMTVTDLKGSVNPLKKRFNADKGHPRFIAVLSAVCRWCLDGAHKIKQTILEREKNTDFRLYIVWTDMLEDDSFSTAKKAATLLNDPHVYHFYEGSKSLGQTIARTLTGKEGVAWDIYMFYGEDSIWEQPFPLPEDYVHQLNPKYFPWADSSTFSFGPDLAEKLREYTTLYRTQ